MYLGLCLKTIRIFLLMTDLLRLDETYNYDLSFLVVGIHSFLVRQRMFPYQVKLYLFRYCAPRVDKALGSFRFDYAATKTSMTTRFCC